METENNVSGISPSSPEEATVENAPVKKVASKATKKAATAKRVAKKVVKKVSPEEAAKVAANAPKAPAKKRKKNYINNADLLIQLALSKEQDKMTEELAKMLFMLVQRYAKHPDYSNIHSYKTDMEAFANLVVVRVWRGFDPTKSKQPNPFAYFTQVIRHAFYQYLNQEKKQRVTKDALRVDIGELPSFTYMENFREERDAEYDAEYEDSEDEDMTHRPGYYAEMPGEVTEISYIYERSEDLPDEKDGYEV